MQAFARANEQPTYYFFTWSRLILYYTKHGQYTLAQYELERYMAQAEQDDYKPAIAEAYKQLGHIYRTSGLKETAADYYRCLFSIPSWPPSSSTPDGTKKPPKSSKKARRGSPCPNTSGR